jgi:hypothetical protein
MIYIINPGSIVKNQYITEIQLYINRTHVITSRSKTTTYAFII